MNGFWWGVLAGAAGLWLLLCGVLALALKGAQHKQWQPMDYEMFGQEITVEGPYDDSAPTIEPDFGTEILVPFSHFTNFGEQVRGGG